MNEGLLALLIFAGVGVAAYLWYTVKEKAGLKKAVDGGDKERLERAVAAALPGEYGYQTLYAHWEERRRYGRTVETSYYNYAIAFKPDRFWVMPLHVNGGKVAVSSPSLYSGDVLGYIDIEPCRKKDKLLRFDVSLYDTQGTPYLQLYMNSTETQSDSSLFNLLQQEECDAFYEMLDSLAAQVNPAHAFIEDHLSRKESGEKEKNARIAAICAIVLAFIPLFSIPAALYSLYRSPKPSQTGGKPNSTLVLAMVSLLVSVGFTAVVIVASIL